MSIRFATTVILSWFFLASSTIHASFVGSSLSITSSTRSTSSSSTELYRSTKEPPKLPPIRDISYGEESRQFRRTVYTHDDWVKHRSPERFWRNVRAIGVSGVYKNLATEVAVTTSIASFIVVWNMVFGGYTDLSGVSQPPLMPDALMPILNLPLTPFTLSSPALGLLLGKYREEVWAKLETFLSLSHLSWIKF